MLQQAGACRPPEVLFIAIIRKKEYDRQITETVGMTRTLLISIFNLSSRYIFCMFHFHLGTSMILHNGEVELCVEQNHTADL